MFHEGMLRCACGKPPLKISIHLSASVRFSGQAPHQFSFQNFRKPKRIRTAFSPNQLLRLENAFEKNHYVVGHERKDLASSLNLTETQVSNLSKVSH